MRKIISICLLLTLLLSCAVCVYADGQTDVIFTSNSSFAVGGTATVDLTKTAQTVLNDDAITSDMYNAALEMNMSVSWICSNGADKKGTSVTWMTEDAGKEYTCRVGFYADKALTEFIGFVDSQPFTVSDGSAPQKVEITPTGPFYLTVGKSFQQQLSCNVQGVTFENFRTSFPNGIDISSSGLISGTPSKAGFWYVTIAAYKNGEQIGDVGVEFYVEEGPAVDPPKITTKTLPEATVGQSYYVKLDCTDPDASFGEWHNPGAANDLSKTGLILTQHGELEGTPSEAGTYTFTIYAAGEGSEGYMTYTLVVKEAEGTDPTEPGTEATTENTGDATEAVTEPGETTDSTKPSKSPAQKGEKDQAENQDNDTDGGDIWIFVAIGLGVLVVGMVVAIVVILKKKKA